MVTDGKTIEIGDMKRLVFLRRATERRDGDCEDDTNDHDWRSPYAIVGGCKQNPGVHGKGGGVLIEEVCMICGCSRLTDTWATDRSNGRQGLTSVSYEAGKYIDQVRRVNA